MSYLKSRFKKTLRSAVMAANYYLGNYQDVVWLVGDARSGTTWVSDLINWNKRYREMFEPFHPTFSKGFCFYQYIRPDDESRLYLDTAAAIFSGRFRHEWVDAQNKRLLYSGLLIKDVSANLFFAWAQTHFPHVKKILLIRSPFAVAVSKQKKKQWKWMADPTQFLSQEALYFDYLTPFENVIQNASDDYIERQVLIWAVIHYVLFRQLKKDDVHILFYEDLYANPEQGLLHLFEYLNNNKPATLNGEVLARLNIPSRVAGKESTIRLGKSPTTAWQEQVSLQQLNNGIRLLKHFGLEKIYREGSQPQKNEVFGLLER